MGTLRLEDLSATNAVAANNLTLRRGQEQFVIPPTYAIADAYLDPTTSWPRVVLDGDTLAERHRVALSVADSLSPLPR